MVQYCVVMKISNKKGALSLNTPQINEGSLFIHVSKIIEKRKTRAGMYANREVTLMYWEIGRYIGSVLLGGERGKYGKKILATLSQELIKKYGSGFEYSKITRMIKFAEIFPDSKTHIFLIPQYKGQMEFSLKWLNRYERQDDENEPIGIILCTKASRNQIELMELDKSGIAVAEYWTNLPPKADFERKIKEILTEAQERLERRKSLPIRKSQKQIDYFFDLNDTDMV
jgi:hypothetical protein